VLLTKLAVNQNRGKMAIWGSECCVWKLIDPIRFCLTRDWHITALGLTASTGNPVLCVVIFASRWKQLCQGYLYRRHTYIVQSWKWHKWRHLLKWEKHWQRKLLALCTDMHFCRKPWPYLLLSSPRGGIFGNFLDEILSGLMRMMFIKWYTVD
jgi:hypothetical protein